MAMSSQENTLLIWNLLLSLRQKKTISWHELQSHPTGKKHGDGERKYSLV